MKLISILRFNTEGGTHSHSPNVTQAAACINAHKPIVRYLRLSNIYYK